jgi:hypothetical protein
MQSVFVFGRTLFGGCLKKGYRHTLRARLRDGGNPFGLWKWIPAFAGMTEWGLFFFQTRLTRAARAFFVSHAFYTKCFVFSRTPLGMVKKSQNR